MLDDKSSKSLFLIQSRYLTDTVNFLLSLVKHDRDRSQAFQAVGLMAMSVKRDILCHLPHIMDMIRVSLPPKDFSGKSVFFCLHAALFIFGCKMLPSFSCAL